MGIGEDEKLLYDCVAEYWKVMFIEMLRLHAEYARSAVLRCRSIRKLIADGKGLTEGEVADMETEELEELADLDAPLT